MRMRHNGFEPVHGGGGGHDDGVGGARRGARRDVLVGRVRYPRLQWERHW